MLSTVLSMAAVFLRFTTLIGLVIRIDTRLGEIQM